MYLVWSGEWDCEATPKKFETLEELQDWLKNWCVTPIECLEFYCKMPDDWRPLFQNLLPHYVKISGVIYHSKV